MPKEFNLLLGSGFSKSLASISTGQELSKEFYTNFHGSDNSLKQKLACYNFEDFYSFGTTDSEIFAIDSICNFYRSIVSKPQNEALETVINSSFDLKIKSELTRIINEKFFSLFNYERVAMILSNYVGSSYILDGDSVIRNQIKSILKEIESAIFHTTNNSILWNGDYHKKFNLFIRYLLYQGYTINFYDLNHDQVLSHLIDSDSYLSKNYQNFFDITETHKLFKNDSLIGYKFNQSLVKKKINHYKLHGDFKIIWDVNKGWLQLPQTQDWRFYENREFFRTSLLFDGNAKSAGIFNQQYHSFSYTNLFISAMQTNPLMIIGYGFGDNHINALIEARYSNLKIDQEHWSKNKLMLFCNHEIENIFHDCLPLSYNEYESSNIEKYRVYHSSDNFESDFLTYFEKNLIEYHQQI